MGISPEGRAACRGRFGCNPANTYMPVSSVGVLGSSVIVMLTYSPESRTPLLL